MIVQKNIQWHIAFLAVLFPVTFLIFGIISGLYVDKLLGSIIFGLGGLLLGIGLNYICYYRKLFTLVLFWTPVPLALLLVFLWISSPFVNTYMSLVFGGLGLGLGLLINNILIRPFQFYRLKKRLLAILYLFFSIAMLGIFKGVPVFNLLLGILAGNYLAIRVISNRRTLAEVKRNFRQGAFFSAFVLLLIAMLSVWMAFVDQHNIIEILNDKLPFVLSPINFRAFLFSSAIVLAVIQYFLTLYTSTVMFRYRMRKRPSMDMKEV
jgi:MFS family permease